MDQATITIFIIEPYNSFPTKIVYADNESDARAMANAEAFPAKRKADSVGIEEDVYNDPKSICYSCQLQVTRWCRSNTSLENNDTAVIEYKGKSYYLKKNDADDVIE